MEKQLTNLMKIDLNKIKCGEKKENKFAGYKYKEIKIKYNEKDLILKTPKVFSFGVTEFKGGKYTSYSLPLSFGNNHGDLKEQEEWIENFEKVFTKYSKIVGGKEIKCIYRKTEDIIF